MNHHLTGAAALRPRRRTAPRKTPEPRRNGVGGNVEAMCQKKEEAAAALSNSAWEKAQPSWLRAHTTTFSPSGASLEIYPHALRVKVTARDHSRPPPPRTAFRPRGQVSGLSVDSAARLRRACTEYEVPGSQPWAVTLTTHRRLPPAEFGAARTRLGRWCKDRRIPAVVRTECQHRGAFHLHGVVWLRVEAEAKEIRAAWLRATGEAKDAAARRRSAKIDPVGDLAGWVAYLAKKPEAGEPAAPGRAWAVWCKDRFVKIAPKTLEVGTKQLDRVRRTVERLLSNPRARKVRRRHLPRCQSWARLLNGGTAKRIVEHAIATAPTELLQAPARPVQSTPAAGVVPNQPSHTKDDATPSIPPVEPPAAKSSPAFRREWLSGWQSAPWALILGWRELATACRGPPKAGRMTPEVPAPA